MSDKLFWQPGSGPAVENPREIKDFLFKLAKPIYVLAKTDESFRAAADNAFIVHPSIEDSDRLNCQLAAYVPPLPPKNFGSDTFKKRHGLTYAYIAGAMANGITSEKMVARMAENGMTGFFGAGGLSLARIEESVIRLKEAVGDKPFGCNFIHTPHNPDQEMALAALYIRHGINRVSAAAFMKITLPLVYYRIKGIYRDAGGRVRTPNHIIAKVSRVEVARQFFSPPPEALVRQLVENNLVTEAEAGLSQEIPMAQDLTAEADSGGHTDNRPAISLLPTMIQLKNEFGDRFDYDEPLCVGLAGGIATPESAAAGFQMGADYILTGSINQACIESGISQAVKEMLVQAEQADVAMAPAADMFEIGARVQVLKRGTLFPVRAEKLYSCYKQYSAFHEIPDKERRIIENKILMAGFEEKWHETRDFFKTNNNTKEIEKANQDPKHKMALVFRWYLGLASKWALEGNRERKMDYQIWCGPAMGAFNQWVKGTFLEKSDNRQAALIGLNLLFGAGVCTRISWFRNQGIDLSAKEIRVTPMTKEEISAFLTDHSDI